VALVALLGQVQLRVMLAAIALGAAQNLGGQDVFAQQRTRAWFFKKAHCDS